MDTCVRRYLRRGGLYTSGILDRQPAIDRDVYAVEEARGREHHRQRHVRHFLRDAVAAQRDAAFGVDGLVFFGDGVGDAGADGAGADAVDRDLLARTSLASELVNPTTANFEAQ